MTKKKYKTKTNKMNSNFTTDFKKQAIFTAQTYGTKTTVEVDHSDLSLDEVMDVFQTLIIGMGYHENSFKNWVIDRANEYNETDAEDLKQKLEAWKFDEESDDIVLRHRYLKDSEGYESLDELENDFFGPYDSDEKRMDIIGQNGNTGEHYDNDIDDEEIELNGHIWNDEDDIIVGASDEEGIDWDCTKYDGEGNLWETDEDDDYNATLDQDEERYRVTKEDEDEFDDYGKRIEKDRVGFDWDSESEEDYDGQFDDWKNETPESEDDLFEGDEWETNKKLVEVNDRYKKEVKKMNIKQKRKNKD